MRDKTSRSRQASSDPADLLDVVFQEASDDEHKPVGNDEVSLIEAYNEGLNFLHAQDFFRAIPVFKDLIGILKQVHNFHGVFRCLLLLFEAYLKVNLIEEATFVLRELEKISTKVSLIRYTSFAPHFSNIYTFLAISEGYSFLEPFSKEKSLVKTRKTDPKPFYYEYLLKNADFSEWNSVNFVSTDVTFFIFFFRARLLVNLVAQDLIFGDVRASALADAGHHLVLAETQIAAAQSLVEEHEDDPLFFECQKVIQHYVSAVRVLVARVKFLAGEDPPSEVIKCLKDPTIDYAELGVPHLPAIHHNNIACLYASMGLLNEALVELRLAEENHQLNSHLEQAIPTNAAMIFLILHKYEEEAFICLFTAVTWRYEELPRLWLRLTEVVLQIYHRRDALPSPKSDKTDESKKSRVQDLSAKAKDRLAPGDPLRILIRFSEKHNTILPFAEYCLNHCLSSLSDHESNEELRHACLVKSAFIALCQENYSKVLLVGKKLCESLGPESCSNPLQQECMNQYELEAKNNLDLLLQKR